MKRNIKKKSFPILTNDPSFTAWGWVVIDGMKLITKGTIKTVPLAKKLRIRKGDDTVRRIGEINNILLNTIHEYNVKYILTELPHGSQNASAAVMIGACAAILETISNTLDIPIEWYSEADAKKATLGKTSSTKKEMIDRIKQLYKVDWTNTKYKDEATADALAVHYVATKQSSTLKLFKK